jgi:hypothetical protein
VFIRKIVIFLSLCVEGILQLFTKFYFHRKVLIFLRNDHDCKAVDLYNTRKRYAVIESLDFMRHIPWLASCFCKIKKPNKIFSYKLCTGNHSVIAGVCILTQFCIFIHKKYSDLNFNLWICVVQEKDTELKDTEQKSVRSYKIHTSASVS